MSDRRGFTLVELMIVVVIIGILAAILVPNLVSIRERNKIQGESVVMSMALADSQNVLADSLATLQRKLGWDRQVLNQRQSDLDRREHDLIEAAGWIRDGKDIYTEMARSFNQAIATGYRQDGIKINSVAGEYVLTLEERARISGLKALAEDGSYTDLVLPCLGDYQVWYDSTIVSAPSDSVRAEKFFRYANGLRMLLSVLDAQIWQHEKFWRQAVREYHDYFMPLYGHAPADSEMYGQKWQGFVASHPKYASHWPGFYSTQVGVMQGDRPIGDYHVQERRFLERELAQLGDRLTLVQYRALAKRFPDRIAMRKYHQG